MALAGLEVQNAVVTTHHNTQKIVELNVSVFALCRSQGRTARQCKHISSGAVLAPLSAKQQADITRIVEHSPQAVTRIVHQIQSTGKQGAAGPAGPRGFRGLVGPPGAAGRPGAAGSRGVPGAQGTRGAAGAKGAQGAQGSRGAQGARGQQGATGATGQQGKQGAAGPRGVQGERGPRGATGATGPRGPQGPPGGLSCPSGFSPGTLVINRPGGQVSIFTCIG